MSPQGAILFKSQNIVGLPSYRIAHLGLGNVPEHRDIFPSLTVRQNLLLGVKDTKRPGAWRLDDMLGMFPNLVARADTAAGVMMPCQLSRANAGSSFSIRVHAAQF